MAALSANVRPDRPAARAMGSERNRSTRPFFRSSASPTPVWVAAKMAVWTKIPGIRKSTYGNPGGRARLTAPTTAEAHGTTEDVDKQQPKHHRLDRGEHQEVGLANVGDEVALGQDPAVADRV